MQQQQPEYGTSQNVVPVTKYSRVTINFEDGREEVFNNLVGVDFSNGHIVMVYSNEVVVTHNLKSILSTRTEVM